MKNYTRPEPWPKSDNTYIIRFFLFLFFLWPRSWRKTHFYICIYILFYFAFINRHQDRAKSISQPRVRGHERRAGWEDRRLGRPERCLVPGAWCCQITVQSNPKKHQTTLRQRPKLRSRMSVAVAKQIAFRLATISRS